MGIAKKSEHPCISVYRYQLNILKVGVFVVERVRVSSFKENSDTFYIFSCDSSSIADNVRRSVGRSVGLSVCVNEFFSSK